MPAAAVARHHKRERRAAFPGIVAKPRRHLPGQAREIAMPPVEDSHLVDDNVLLEAVHGNIAAQPVEFGRRERREELGVRMDRQAGVGHDAPRS